MPSLIDIRRRIRGVKNMQQITKAMKMVSAARLRRAQEHAIASRPYANMMQRVLSNVAAAAAGNDEAAALPLLQVREEKRIQLIVVSSDTGLAGAFNANLFRMSQRFADEHRETDLRVEAIGRKARDYFRKRNFSVTGEYVGIVDKPAYDKAAEIADKMIDLYSKAEVDAVYIAVNEFKNVMSPNLVLKKILPVEVPQEGEQINYIYEQPPHELLSDLLPRYVEMSIYRALLESISAYHAARMTAMDAATSNAGDVLQDLTLNLNRVRQANITREIIEIVSGAAAL
ncbi:MAG: ATP synthase F1 subunit gamma [Acidobacteriaceae bacterium]|nr:ATP synthase F1 subunit gamma [Terriglobia bacterium]MBV9157988.1 ATP synthase F1 subunit gamma [Acidobacteriaceae bacterium]MBV9765144.1 ATP synthase F1 subunit gamma [Acidobacteriaceae bacterium]